MKFNRYHEPFFGGGAVFFHLNPEFSSLSDINPRLISTYKAVSSDWRKVYFHLKEHHRKHSAYHYYEIRDKQRRCAYRAAADFIYLNRTCWNGMYRVNTKGKFNVPIGDRFSILREDDDFHSISDALSNANIQCRSFSDALLEAKRGDFVFLDPPYTVKHNLNGFVKYNEKIFTWKDQERLRDCIVKLCEIGAKVLLMNGAHESIHELFSEFADPIPVTRNTSLSATPAHRGKATEYAFLIGYQPSIPS